ncbi:hypothetical protein Tco_0850203, partial [Tanacetum coccineum]
LEVIDIHVKDHWGEGLIRCIYGEELERCTGGDEELERCTGGDEEVERCSSGG